MALTTGQTLLYLLPELLLLATATAVFALDLIRPRQMADRPLVLPLTATAGLALALIVTIGLIGGGVSARVATMMSVDGLALFFKVIALLAAGLVIWSAVDYLPTRTPYVGEFYALLVVATLAICVTVSANDLVLVYLGMEFLSITSYVLTGFLRRDVRSTEAALKYFLYGAAASAVMLYGISLLYGATGTTDLIAMAGAFASGMAGNLGMLGLPAVVLLMVGLGFKASLAPFHQWAPDAYEGAPTPITAFLSTASKATGFALLVRVFAIGLPMLRAQEWAPLLGAMAIVTMTLGNLVAIQQTNLKRLLAYSSIAQAGYIVIGLASMASTGIFGGLEGTLLYLFAYLFTNLGAFLVVIAVENATGAVDLAGYAGLVRRSPLLAGMLVLFLLSLAGIPPTGGFLGKFLVFGAAIRSQLLTLAVIGIVNSAIAAFYYLNIVRYMFFMPAPAAQAGEIAAPMALRVPLWICAAMTLMIGLVAQPFIDWATRSAVLLAAL